MYRHFILGGEANLLAPSEPHPLVVSVRELGWYIGKYTTFNKHDVFKGLGNALPEAKDEDTGTPPADPAASSAMADIENTQLSPVETQLADDPTFCCLGTNVKPKMSTWVLHWQIPPPSPAMTDAKTPSPVLWRLDQWITPQYQQPNLMPGSRRICQPHGVLALLDWKIQLPPPPYC